MKVAHHVSGGLHGLPVVFSPSGTIEKHHIFRRYSHLFQSSRWDFFLVYVHDPTTDVVGYVQPSLTGLIHNLAIVA